jgi:phosphonate dehydrogenase
MAQAFTEPAVRPRVVVTQWIHPEAARVLAEFCETVLNDSRAALPGPELLARCRDAQGLMAFMPDRVDEAFLAGCPGLQVVAAALKGYDNFDVEAMRRRGIAFCIQEDLLTAPTAELALALMLGLGRHLLEGDAHVRGGAFRGWQPRFYGIGLEGSRVGLLGMGRLGRALAARLKPMGCRVQYCDPRPLSAREEQELGAAAAGFEDLVRTADYLVVLLPLTAQTRGLLGRETLARLKPGCLLVNVSRGGVVDEEAVAGLLEQGSLGGYAADVFAMEDWALPGRPSSIPGQLLDQRARTLFTPHLGSAVASVRLAIELKAAQQLRAWFRGDVPDGRVC